MNATNHENITGMSFYQFKRTTYADSIDEHNKALSDADTRQSVPEQPSTSPSMHEHTMESWDGTELFYRSWQIGGQKAKRAVILFHRGHEHSERWQDVIDQMQLPGVAYFAWDARGHGHSSGERGYARNYGSLVQDVDAFVRHISQTYEIAYENIVVMAHSVGSVLVSTWIHDYAPPIRALVLGSPALRVRLYAPFAISGLRLLQKFKNKAFISSYVKGRLLTHDPYKRKSYDEDPLITPNISVNILLGLHDAGTRLMSDAGAINLPVLILSSGSDFVVKQSAQHRFFNQLGSPVKEMEIYPGFRHDTFNELDNHLPINKAREFILDQFSNDRPVIDLRQADKAGYTNAEYEELIKPLPKWSPRRLGFAATELLMHTVGRLSDGVRIGLKTGFDSGSMLDYVYRDEARGITPLGKLIDKQFLNSPGWKGIRQRKVNLETLLHEAITELHDTGDVPRILDVATGHGRYVLDVIQSHNDKPITALLRDFSKLNVEAGKQLAGKMALDNVVYEQGDAFSRTSLATADNQPNIVIISGLYELFPENGPVRNSLAGIADLIDTGGYLIYTNQPWHPQLEFIARVLRSHRDGKPWVMRRRTQQEMDQLVVEAGFKKVHQLIDEEGIFSVSVARKQ